MVEPMTTTIMVLLMPTICSFITDLMQLRQSKKEWKTARKEREMDAEAQRKEDKRKWEAEEKREMESRKVRDKDDECKRQHEEELETERRARMQSERAYEQNAEYEKKQFVQQCLLLFCYLLRQYQFGGCGHNCRCCKQKCQNRIEGYHRHPEYAQLLDNLPLIQEYEDDNGQLLILFDKTMSQIRDNGSSSFDAAGSSNRGNYTDYIKLLESPNQLSNALALLESPEQFSVDGNNMLSMVMAELDEVTGDAVAATESPLDTPMEAKEEGNHHFNKKNFKEAIKCYFKSIDQSPTATAYANRAMAYIKRNMYIEAENDCTEALKIDVKCFKAYARRAMALSSCKLS